MTPTQHSGQLNALFIWVLVTRASKWYWNLHVRLLNIFKLQLNKFEGW